MLLLRFLVYVAAGDFLIADRGNHRVQRCSSLTSECETVAGTGVVDISFGIQRVPKSQKKIDFSSHFSSHRKRNVRQNPCKIETSHRTPMHEVANTNGQQHQVWLAVAPLICLARSPWNSTAVTTW